MYVSLKNVLLLVILISACVGAAWLIMKPEVKETDGEVVAPPEISPTLIAFVSLETEESLFVTFGTSTALINGVGYSNVLLNQVEAVSGAKYENPTENLQLWNKGDEVTLQRGRRVLFIGKNEAVYLPEDAATSTMPTATTTEAHTLSGTYVWVETVKGDRTITPKSPGVFSVTFSDGTISGTTDCNGFSGTYTISENTLSIGALAMTKMFCEGSQEMEYTQQFVGELQVDRQGTSLTLTHTDGTQNKFEAK